MTIIIEILGISGKLSSLEQFWIVFIELSWMTSSNFSKINKALKWMVNIRTIYTMTCHYQPLTGSLTSAFDIRVILLAESWISFSVICFLCCYFLPKNAIPKGQRDKVDLAGIVVVWKGKRTFVIKLEISLWFRNYCQIAKVFSLVEMRWNWLQCHTLTMHCILVFWICNVFLTFEFHVISL